MRKAIKELIKSNIQSKSDLMAAKRKIARKYNIGILSNADILRELDINVKTHSYVSLRRLLRKRAMRTLSGIAPVAVLTKPYPCPGECVYCPTEKGVPQSYLSNEPAVMRAIRCNYNPYKQVQLRLRALEANGHEPTKIEIIVIGGTWSVLPRKYKYWYINECFRAANEWRKETRKQENEKKANTEELRKVLFEGQKRNERAKYKIVGLTLETRPDYINAEELIEMRELGCTRVEIGVQAVDDEILKLNKRGHGVKEIVQATELLKNFGFKVTYHIMPGLPGATPAKDFKMFKQLFTPLDKLKILSLDNKKENKDKKIKRFIVNNKNLTEVKDERFQPDQIKFYPTVVTRGSLLYRWWRSGKYKPYSDKVLQNLIIKCKQVVPPYVRVIRLIRDIPGESIMAGNMITNLRQILKDRGVKCQCIRCREVKGEKLELKSKKLEIIEYKASGGIEYFLQYTNAQGNILYGFCRLRLPVGEIPSNKAGRHESPLQGAAFIRELHVYGELVPVGAKKRVQHAGLGKKLMAEAEKIARQNGFKKMAVIAGVGTRDYYRKLGYRLKDTYMLKILK